MIKMKKVKPLPFMKAAIDKAAGEAVRKYASNAGAVLQGIKAMQDFVKKIAEVRRSPTLASVSKQQVEAWQKEARALLKQYPVVVQVPSHVEVRISEEEKFNEEVSRKIGDVKSISVEEIRKIRRQLCMSQKDFAVAVGVTVNTVQRWEKGKTLCKGKYAQKAKGLSHNG